MLDKIGPHGQRSTPEFQRWAARARGAKAMDLAALKSAKEKNPTLFTVFRYPLDDAEKETVGPQQLAEMILAKIEEVGFRPTAIEYKNEWRCYFTDDAPRHLREQREFSEIMHRQGFATVAGEWPFGCPNQSDVLFWQAEGWGDCDYLGKHEYSNKIAGPHDLWHMLRHRLVHAWTNGNHPPIIITEAGIDDLDGLGNGWIRQGMSAEEYLQFLTDYNAELMKDDYVLFAVVFTSGGWGGMEGFETDGISDTQIVPLYTGNEAPIKPRPIKPEGANMQIGNITVKDLRLTLPRHATLSYEVRSIGGIEQIVIHHSATPDDRSAEAIARYHVDTLGWPGIGYHFLVHQDGSIEYTQPIEIISYGVADRNKNSLHICLVGTFTDTPPGDIQIAAAKSLIDNLDYALGRVYPVVGHSEIATPGNATACPGRTWPQWKPRLYTATPGEIDWRAKYEALAGKIKAIAAEL